LTKSLINEIEVLQHEQKEKKSNTLNRYQFDFSFKKKKMLIVVKDIIFHYVENSGTITSSEEEKLRDLLQEFVPKFFAMNDDEEMLLNGGEEESAMEVDYMDSNGNIPKEEPNMEIDNGVEDEKMDSDSKKRPSRTLYANSHLYCFFRLYQVWVINIDVVCKAFKNARNLG
jgi:hypothetical protein